MRFRVNETFEGEWKLTRILNFKLKFLMKIFLHEKLWKFFFFGEFKTLKRETSKTTWKLYLMFKLVQETNFPNFPQFSSLKFSNSLSWISNLQVFSMESLLSALTADKQIEPQFSHLLCFWRKKNSRRILILPGNDGKREAALKLIRKRRGTRGNAFDEASPRWPFSLFLKAIEVILRSMKD